MAAVLVKSDKITNVLLCKRYDACPKCRSKKSFEKGIDKGGMVWYTTEALERAAHKRVRNGKRTKKVRKKQKTFEKPLDKREMLCYNNKAVRQTESLRQTAKTWSLKIEQQDEFVLSKR